MNPNFDPNFLSQTTSSTFVLKPCYMDLDGKQEMKHLFKLKLELTRFITILFCIIYIQVLKWLVNF
jgi:hypothetical protein